MVPGTIGNSSAIRPCTWFPFLRGNHTRNHHGNHTSAGTMRERSSYPSDRASFIANGSYEPCQAARYCTGRGVTRRRGERMRNV
jgi:hypothetical protein